MFHDKIKSYSFILLFIATGIFAQNKSVQWGKQVLGNIGEAQQHIIGESNKEIFSLRPLGTNFSFDTNFEFLVFDKATLNKLPERSTTIKFPSRLSYRTRFEEAFVLDDQVLVFHSLSTRNTNNITLNVQQLSNTGILSSEPTELMEINYREGNLFNRSFGDYLIVPNRYQNNFLIVGNIPVNNIHAKEKLKLSVYNKSLKKLWTKDFELPYPNKHFELISAETDAAGNAYILAKKYNVIARKNNKGEERYQRESQGWFEKNDNYSFVVIYYNENKKDFFTYELSIPEKSIVDIAMRVNKKGDVVCAGFFTERRFKLTEDIRGTFYMRINRESGKQERFDFKEFDERFLLEVKNSRIRENIFAFLSLKDVSKSGGLRDFRLKEFELKEDGSAVLLAEQFKVNYSDNSPNANSDANFNQTIDRNYTVYHNTLVVIKINKDAKVNWHAVVPKKQITKFSKQVDSGFSDVEVDPLDWEFSSYCMKLKGDDIYILYNDRKSNSNRIEYGKRLKPLRRVRKSSAVLIKIDRNGKQYRSELFNSRKEKTIIAPLQFAHYQNLQSNQLFLIGRKIYFFNLLFSTRKYRFGTVLL